MTKISSLHEDWMQDPAYRAEYDALEGEYEVKRAELRRMAKQQFEALLLEALDSPEKEMTAKDWREIHAEALALVAARKKAR